MKKFLVSGAISCMLLASCLQPDGVVSDDAALSRTIYLSAERNIWQTRANESEGTSGTFYIAKEGESEWAYTASAGELKIPQGTYDIYYISGDTPEDAESLMSANTDIIIGMTTERIMADADIIVPARHAKAKVKMILTNVPESVEAIRLTLHGLKAGVNAKGEYSGTGDATIEMENTADNTWSSDYCFAFPSDNQDLSISLIATKTDGTTHILESSSDIRLAAGYAHTIKGSYTKICNNTISSTTEDWQVESEEEVEYDTPRYVYIYEENGKDIYADIQGYDVTNILSYVFDRSDGDFSAYKWHLPSTIDFPDKVRQVIDISQLLGKLAYIDGYDRYYYAQDGYTLEGTGNICVVYVEVPK